MSQKTTVRFRADPELVEDIARLLEASDGAEILRRKTEEDTDTGVDFGLVEVATLVGLVGSLFFKEPIVPSLLQIFRKKPGSKITIETPRRTVSIVSSAQFSEDEVRRLIEALTH
jgi:hypothetical protein